MSVKGRPRVVILGGGFGGLEAAFYLRKRAGDGAEIVLISDRSDFIFKPNTIYVPFGLDPERLRIGLEEPTSRQQILFVKAAIAIVPAAIILGALGFFVFVLIGAVVGNMR